MRIIFSWFYHFIKCVCGYGQSIWNDERFKNNFQRLFVHYPSISSCIIILYLKKNLLKSETEKKNPKKLKNGFKKLEKKRFKENYDLEM